MLHLDKNIKLDKDTLNAANLTDHFSDDDLSRIGHVVWDGYSNDKESRKVWEQRTEAAMKLALQIQQNRSFPWPNCSNVTFPLITVSVLQFHARAYPSIINGTHVVKCRVVGEDATGLKMARADRISTHMSYQVLEEDESWEEQHDRLLLNIAVVGTAFIKTYRKMLDNHNVSELVLAKDLVLNYWAKSVDDCQRKTQIIAINRNEVYERVMRGIFRDVLEEPWYTQTNGPAAIKVDMSTQGLRPSEGDEDSPLICLEQHCSLDLDGDGYAEPYIITIDSNSHKVLRIVTRVDREEDIQRVQEGKYKGRIISIRATEYFTKYGFIPSPDGGIYDIGLGTLTGPLNDTVNTLVNQLIDSGTLANSGGGFLGRGVKIRGGNYSFSPFEWKRVDATSEDLTKSIVPLPIREPSGVLLSLLSLLINYTNRISGSTDTMVGENPGQNTPAETSRTMVEQGTKIYNAIFKRIWRSMRQEFKKLYILNSIYMPMKQSFGHSGFFALREDYLGDPSSVIPVADPNITSQEMKIRQAILLKQNAHMTAGYDLEKVERRVLEAMQVEGIDVIYPGPKKVPPLPNPKMQAEQIKMQTKQLEVQSKELMFMSHLEEERRVNSARIGQMHAKIILTMEQAGGIKQGQHLEEMEFILDTMKAHDESLGRQMKLLQERLKDGQQQNDNGNRVQGMEAKSGDEGSSSVPGSSEGEA